MTNQRIASRPTTKLTVSAMCIALYCIVMYFTQHVSFGAYQIRIATSLYGLGYFFPFLTLPMGLANALSNMLMGGFGFFDIIGGGLAGILTTGCAALLGKSGRKLSSYLVALPVTLIPGLLVPMWLAPALSLPYSVLALNLCIGQILPGIVSVLLIKSLPRILRFH
ncbi:MAG: QueT transporter family protein [Clostridia bacterium]|nr:QueT transporter family protein [Clostridia bacterium]MBQ4574058.1 QueT transporter family protein [Clostridia bacterium]